MGIRDTRMLARALEQRWPMSPEYRQSVIRVLMQIALDSNNSPRERTSAAKALISADRNNIEQEKIQQNDEHHGDRLDMERLHRIAGVAKQLGFDTIAQRAIEAGSSGGTIDANPE